MTQAKVPARPSSRRRILLHILLGFAFLCVVFVISAQTDLSATQRMLSTTAGYIKEQCNRYARIELATETKSLMRVIESCKQISHQLADDDGSSETQALRVSAEDSYVSGIYLLDVDGQIVSEYHESGSAPAELTEALASPALLDTSAYPGKRYAVRLHCADGSELDLAATARQDEPGIVVAYYHTPQEYLESFNLSISSLLDGYQMERDGTIVVSSGSAIVASNDKELVGRSTDELPILRKISTTATGGRLTHTNRADGSISQYFGLMQCGRSFYVYSFLPERSVFSNTPSVLLYASIVYLIILSAISTLRWRISQRYRERQLQEQQRYAEQLRIKNEQLSAAVEQADRANAAKTSFLSRMSHDIRTPLGGIIGLLEIDAAHPDDTALVNANREKMRVAADHLLALINDILQMSKLESGEIALSHELIDLNQLSHDILTIISQRAADSGITMLYHTEPMPFSVRWVYGSPLHLRQIFLNIYSNCIKYNRVGGTVTSRVRCLDRTEHAVTYQWTISDTGIGMSEEFLQHVFDPFTQEHSDARSVNQGTGLGMAIVKGLIDKMHGTIEIHSKEGEGSEFIITLPFEIADGEAPTADHPSVAEGSVRGLHLLLAEDNALNAEIAKLLLEDGGAAVTAVDNGQQAVDLFRSSAPGTFDAILMDVMMPIMDGLTATQTIRTLDRPDAKSIPIIAMTANAFAEDAQRCLDAGMNAHLAKPLNIQALIAAIARCTGQQEQRTADPS